MKNLENEKHFLKDYQKACKYLNDTRKEKGLSYNKIALDVGFSKSNTIKILNARYTTSFINFLKLAKAIDADYYNHLTNQ